MNKEIGGIIERRSKTGVYINGKWYNYSKYANYAISWDSLSVGDSVKLQVNEKDFVDNFSITSQGNSENATKEQKEIMETHTEKETIRDGNIRRANQMNIVIPTLLESLLRKAKDTHDEILITSLIAEMVVTYSNDTKGEHSLVELIRYRLAELDMVLGVKVNGATPPERDSLSKAST